MRYIELHLQDEAPSVGCGVRRFIDITGVRSKQAVLFHVPTLTQIKLDLRLLKAARDVPLNKTETRRLRARLRAIAKGRSRLGLRVPTAQLKLVIDTLDDSLGTT